MSEQKHTPGPWKANDNEIIIGDFTLRHHWRGGASDSEMRANARLIAAAPEMLAALLDVWKVCSHEHWPTVGAAITKATEGV